MIKVFVTGDLIMNTHLMVLIFKIVMNSKHNWRKIHIYVKKKDKNGLRSDLEEVANDVS
jgi:hypothetical protein